IFPTHVVVKFASPLRNGTGYRTGGISLLDKISNDTLRNHAVLSVTGPTRPGGARVDFRTLSDDPRSLQLIPSMNKMLSKDARYALLTVTLKGSPYTQDSITVVKQLREQSRSHIARDPPDLQG